MAQSLRRRTRPVKPSDPRAGGDWNDGIMEQWNNASHKLAFRIIRPKTPLAGSSLVSQFRGGPPRYLPIIPPFHYSTIPSPARPPAFLAQKSTLPRAKLPTPLARGMCVFSLKTRRCQDAKMPSYQIHTPLPRPHPRFWPKNPRCQDATCQVHGIVGYSLSLTAFRFAHSAETPAGRGIGMVE
jgi:hypothetical protein